MKKDSLTNRETEQLDNVDNAIHNLLTDLVPGEAELEWDMAVIGEIRDTITEHFVKLGRCTEKEFAPYIEGEQGQPFPFDKAKYLASPSKCPYCGSADITGQQIDIESRQATQPVTCNACEKQWTDIYTLIDVEAE